MEEIKTALTCGPDGGGGRGLKEACQKQENVASHLVSSTENWRKIHLRQVQNVPSKWGTTIKTSAHFTFSQKTIMTMWSVCFSYTHPSFSQHLFFACSPLRRSVHFMNNFFGTSKRPLCCVFLRWFSSLSPAHHLLNQAHPAIHLSWFHPRSLVTAMTTFLFS